ncbi:membrane-spanning 4-domains subfamily A member 4A-like [Aquarana catesbeiana]|uniref:membrane-spanning 4-domains subfamily A member 4A-like n=1 Tax=Aquarana catesbeiana TaxID=8400 RepID=UPI003CC9662F
MSSTQFGTKSENSNFSQSNPGAPPPAQWNVPPGSPGHNLSPNPQMWNAPTLQQWNNPTIIPPMTQSTTFHQVFLEGKPKTLGKILIVVGILHLGMGIGLIFTASYTAVYSGIPFWGPVFNIIAGSLSVGAVSKPSMSLIKGSLGLCIIISIFSLVGLILNIVDYFVLYYCYGSYYECNNLVIGGHVLRGFFIFTYLLQFSVSVSLSVFGCRAVSNPTPPAQVFVVQSCPAALQPSAVPGSYPVYPSQQPPPYMTQSGMGDGPTA